MAGTIWPAAPLKLPEPPQSYVSVITSTAAIKAPMS
jgi:hypothetical protein